MSQIFNIAPSSFFYEILKKIFKKINRKLPFFDIKQKLRHISKF